MEKKILQTLETIPALIFCDCIAQLLTLNTDYTNTNHHSGQITC